MNRKKGFMNRKKAEQQRMKFFKEGLGENFFQKIVPQWYVQRRRKPSERGLFIVFGAVG